MATTEQGKLRVAVSPAMARLRAVQTRLNKFCHLTELACGFAGRELSERCGDGDPSTRDLMGHIDSPAWFPNMRGQSKVDQPAKATIADLRGNFVYIYRATLVSFYTAFEDYLDEALADCRPNKAGWGPLVRSLAEARLHAAPVPVRLRSLICADYCRHVRNRIVHAGFEVPKGLDGAALANWERDLVTKAKAAGWPMPDVAGEIDFARQHVIGGAVQRTAKAKGQGAVVPIEYFYMLFGFTHFDALAFEIEEARLPEDARPGGVVQRDAGAVRRRDLVLT